jgi:hypothetical protein
MVYMPNATAGGNNGYTATGQMPPQLQGWISQVAASPNGGQDMANNLTNDFQNLQQAKAALQANPQDPNAQAAFQQAQAQFKQDKEAAEQATGIKAPHHHHGGRRRLEAELAQAQQVTGIDGMFAPGGQNPNGGGTLV